MQFQIVAHSSRKNITKTTAGNLFFFFACILEFFSWEFLLFELKSFINTYWRSWNAKFFTLAITQVFVTFCPLLQNKASKLKCLPVLFWKGVTKICVEATFSWGNLNFEQDFYSLFIHNCKHDFVLLKSELNCKRLKDAKDQTSFFPPTNPKNEVFSSYRGEFSRFQWWTQHNHTRLLAQKNKRVPAQDPSKFFDFCLWLGMNKVRAARALMPILNVSFCDNFKTFCLVSKKDNPVFKKHLFLWKIPLVNMSKLGA